MPACRAHRLGVEATAEDGLRAGAGRAVLEQPGRVDDALAQDPESEPKSSSRGSTASRPRVSGSSRLFGSRKLRRWNISIAMPVFQAKVPSTSLSAR
ncbi:MAG: hypothetical protein WKG01_16335 [Kofleriaceae bacterium]